MSYCKSFGKDKVIFATKEDHSVPSKIELPETEPPPGLILPNGDINWNCPCLGGMATGPCGVEFREAFSCFHFSEENPKGSDCYKSFSSMQECFGRYPTVYNKSDNDDDDDADTDNDKNNADTTSGDMAAMIQSGDALKSDDNSKNNHSNSNNSINNNSNVDSADQIDESKVQSTAKTAIKTK